MNRQALEYYARKYGLLLVVGSALVIFILPLLMRIVQGSPITPGAESYSHLREANLLHLGIIGQDPLHESLLAPNPYAMLLSIMQLVGAPWLLPPLLGVLLLALLFWFFSRIIAARAVVVLTLSVVLLSPSMSVLATHHAPILLCMIFIAIALLTFQEHAIIASAMLCLAIITAPQLGIIAAILFAVMFFRHHHYHELTSVTIASAVALVWFFLWQDAPGIRELLSPVFNTRIFFELGNAQGMSIFLLILAAYGIVVTAGKSTDLVLYALLLFVGAFFVPSLLPAATIALSALAGMGIYNLITSRWDLALLQSSLLWLVGCIGLFILITALRERTVESPDADFAHVLTTLRNEHHEGAVLTDPAYAPMIEYFSGRKATLNAQSSSSAVQELLYSRTPNTVYPLLVSTNTTYVLITKEMELSFFTRSDDGILFLVHNTERFATVEQSDKSTLWYFIAPK